MNGLTEERRETLQKMVNIGFGRSTSSLADLLGVHIELSVPDVVAIRTEELLDYLVKVMDGVEGISLVQQTFLGEFFGEAVLGPAGPGRPRAGGDVGRGLGLPAGPGDGATGDGGPVRGGQRGHRRLPGAVRRALGNQPDLYHPPTVLMENIHSAYFQDVLRARPGESLLIQTNFKVELRAVTGYLLILMPKDCLEWLYREVDNFLGRMLG